jgi:NCS1 family nucleobase:cation symporter-1
LDVSQPRSPSPSLHNADLAPVGRDGRTFGTIDLAALWVGLVVCVPTYTLVGSLLDLGFSPLQGLAVIAAANVIVLAPMVLSESPGEYCTAPP